MLTPDLRLAGPPLQLPFRPVLAFAAKDRSFIGNLEQCNGCGGCRKDAPTMCPTFIATGEEIMSTRGRANAIRAALELRGMRAIPLRSAELEAALSNCLSCKACTQRMPFQRQSRAAQSRVAPRPASARRPVLARTPASVPWTCWGGSAASCPPPPTPPCAALVARRCSKKPSAWPRNAPSRPTPRNALTTGSPGKPARHSPTRGRVILWDDTFVRYHEPHIGIAAVAVLEAAGFEVALAA